MLLTRGEIEYLINSPKRNPTHWCDMLMVQLPVELGVEITKESDGSLAREERSILLKTVVKNHKTGNLEWVLPLQGLRIRECLTS